MASPDEDIELRAIRAFKACCDVEPDALDAAIDAACGADAPLRARVLKLLAVDAAAVETNGAKVLAGGRGRQIVLGDLVQSMAEGEGEEPELPEALGPYRVVALLGAGGMGLVYEAEQARPKRRVALKTVHPHLRTDVMLELFLREVELMGTLTHAAIPQVYEAGQDDGIAWLAMELVRGQPLREHVAGRSLEERLHVLAQVLDGVAHAHAHGIVHCDLKPENLLVTVEGQPKILDFGLATTLANRLPSFGVAGTIGYLAPEQHRSGAVLDARVDVFALGIVTREVLQGLELPKDIDAIIAKATAHEPGARYPSARELGEDLTRYLADLPVRARAPTLGYRLHKWLRRWRAVVRTLEAVVVAALLVVIGALSYDAINASRAEAGAHERLVNLQRRMAELERADQQAEADALFALFTRMHDNIGTRAAYDAWVWRAEREAAAGRRERAIEAWAEAATSAVDDDDAVAALTRLAQAFAANGNWGSLDHVLASLPPVDAEVVDLRFRTAVYHRELDVAASLGATHALVPLVTALATARPIDSPDLDAVWPTTWQGRDAFLVRDTWDRRMRILDRDFKTLVAREQIDPEMVSRLPAALVGAPGWFMERDPAGQDFVCRLERRCWPLPMHHTFQGVGWMVGEDMHAVIGSAGDDRDLLSVIVPADGSSPRVTQAPPTIRLPASDVTDLLRADLDGDGQPEIAMAFGAWRGYELRVFEVDDQGAFTSRARVRHGVAESLAVMPRGDGTSLLVATKTNSYPSVSVFGRADPDGPPTGLYFYAYSGHALAQVAFVPFPSELPPAYAATKITAGDFDGDGLVDLAVDVEGTHTWLLRQVAPLRFESIVIGELVPLAAAQLDDDPASELIVRVGNVGTSPPWVLGAGSARVPPLPRAARERRASAAVDGGDPVFARVWQSARTLAELGLLARAADNLEAAAQFASTNALEAAVLSEAAGLRLELGSPDAAEVLYERALALADPAGALATEALVGAARSWVAASEPQRALAHYQTLAQRQLDPVLAEEARTHVAWLRQLVETPTPELTFTWQGPVAPPLSIVAPESFTRATEGSLALRVFSDQDVIAEVPVRYEGGRVAIEAELSLERLEVAAGLSIELRRASDDVRVGGIVLDGLGGDLSISRIIGCRGGPLIEATRRAARASATAEPERLHLTLDHWPAGARIDARSACRFDSAAGTDRWSLPRPLDLTPGDYRLVLAGTHRLEWGSVAEARLRLQRVTLRGLRVRHVTPTNLSIAHDYFVNGDPTRALADYRSIPGAERFALMAELELADDVTITARLRPLLGAWRDEDPTLAHLLRVHPEGLARLLYAADPPSFAALYEHAWGGAVRHLDDAAIRAALLEPTLERLAGDNEAEVRLLEARALMHFQMGELERAQRIVERIATDADAMLLLARIAHARGDAAGATRWVRAWRDRMPIAELAQERLAVDPDTAPLIGYLTN